MKVWITTIILATTAMLAIVAASCNGTGTNSANLNANKSTASAANATNSAANTASNGGHEHMPGMNGNHQSMGEQHRSSGMRMEDRQIPGRAERPVNQNSDGK